MDTQRHTVPLDEVVFDTFRGDFVPLSEASPELISRLRDAIRPVYEPRYEEAAEAEAWLDGNDRVLGLAMGGEAYAYPVKTLVFREIVNEDIHGTPVVITYCPLCASGVVYDRRVDGRTLLFGNTSALYESDMVMFDHETGSYWHQVSGEAIVGPLANMRLKPLPSMIATLDQWRHLHPETRVLSNGRAQAAGRSDLVAEVRRQAQREEFFFPVKKGLKDRRLPLGAEVLLVRVAGAWKAYPLEANGPLAINDTVGGVRVVVLASGATAHIYRGAAEGRELTLRPVEGSEDTSHPTFRDDETGTHWDLAGRAISGPLARSSLDPVPARRGFWFSIAGVAEAIEVYGQVAGDQ